MTQGPPTPPPTSATELRDEARDVATASKSSASVGQSSGSPPPTSDSYQQAFHQICNLALRNDFSAVVQYAELHDLNGANDKSYTRLLLVTPLVLAYLVLDDLTPAQHVLARLPDSILHHPLSRALLHLLASTSERKYANIYLRAQALGAMAQQPDFPDATLAKVVASMVVAFVESFRRRTFLLLSKAFASIKVSQAQIYLGFTRELLLSEASSGHWQYEAATDTLYPVHATSAVGGAKSTVPSSLSTFNQVATGLTKLEA
ncbi:hypothetical protein HYDPIDRAFT_79650 [Hydnomerulius pinastri MD-312]|nr:hypothetical protein HYDPIDRAFT_79650 [Hydnomerulius pinastri MD-312]